MILKYNKYMNGVDKCDQYLTYYSLGRKARKWWEKVFFRLCELWIINAMVLYFAAYPDFAKQCQAHKLFRVQLAHGLVQPLLDAKAAVGNNVHSPVPGRRSIEDDVRLKSILLRVVIQSVEDMHLVGIRKAKITNIKTQKLQTIVQNVISLSAKVV